MKSADCVLFSGAANGAESEFGAAAERRGIEEVNFTFAGHNDARHRGIRVLTNEDLIHGDVSLAYVGKLMNRHYRDTPLFKKVLQSIWHQINAGQEIYVVGMILEDQTVKGGTGWGVELAKLFNRPVSVYDQERKGWFSWKDNRWVAETPTITDKTFVGTGTRNLTDEGRGAIHDLFENSFGPAGNH